MEKNPWGGLPKRTPYQLPIDTEAVEAYGRVGRVAADPDRFGLHLKLMPVPFIGNPDARLVILARSPSFADQDTDDFAEPAFRDATIGNLTHTAEGRPFFTVDPRFEATSTYRWWYPKLCQLIKDAGREAVMEHVMCLQAFPYHSRELAVDRNLPSQAYTRSLLLDRMRDGAFVVGMMRQSWWKRIVPDLQTYESVDWCKNPSRPHLTRKNLDMYDAVLATLQ